MGTLLVVDGSDVCRAPVATHTLQQATGWPPHTSVVSRGLDAEAGRTMCDGAAARLGFSGSAIAFYGAHRANLLTIADIASAELIITAERAQRSAVVRMLPGTQASVFTFKEALALATVLVERRRSSALSSAADLASLARALHGARGTVPVTEPPVRTGLLHRRRPAAADPLTIGSGHDGRSEHRRITQETVDIAAALGVRLTQLMKARLPAVELVAPATRAHRLRRFA